MYHLICGNGLQVGAFLGKMSGVSVQSNFIQIRLNCNCLFSMHQEHREHLQVVAVVQLLILVLLFNCCRSLESRAFKSRMWGCEMSFTLDHILKFDKAVASRGLAPYILHSWAWKLGYLLPCCFSIIWGLSLNRQFWF